MATTESGKQHWIVLGTTLRAEVEAGSITSPVRTIGEAPKTGPITATGRIRALWMSPYIFLTMRKMFFPRKKFTGLRHSWFYRYKLKPRLKKNANNW